MEIKGIEGMSTADINKELERGGRFVIYQYTISIIIMTFRRSSDVIFLRGGEGGVGKGLKYSLTSFLLGWWGIPWGPIYTIGSLWKNFGGGTDVTEELLQSLNAQAAADQEAAAAVSQ